jgi:hypothetical protein
VSTNDDLHLASTVPRPDDTRVIEVLGILLASAGPVVLTAWIAVRAGRANAKFFDALVGARGPLPRTQAWSRLGIRHDVIGTFDYGPGLSALRRPCGDPGLDELREGARRWTYGYYCQLLVAMVSGAVISWALRVSPEVPLFLAFLSWALLQYLPAGHVLWASRPDAREDMTLGMHAYALLGLVMAVTFSAAFGLVAILVLIHG